MKTRILVVGVVVSLLLMAATAHAQSELSKIAASMNPGEWREFHPTGWNNSAVLSPSVLGCSVSDYITQYSDSAAWANGKLWFLGQSHGDCHGGELLHYDEATNTMSYGPWPSQICQSGSSANPCFNHGYDHTTMAANGDVYYRHAASLMVLRLRAGMWTRLPDIPAQSYGFNGALKFVPSFGLVFVDGDWGVWRFNLTTNSWSQIANTTVTTTAGLPVLGSMPGAWMDYSIIKAKLLIGSGSKLWSLDQSGLFTQIQNPPTSLGINVSLQTIDPITGNLLALAGTTMYQFDITGNAWSQVQTTIPFPNPGDGVVEASIPEHGVVMFLRYAYGNGPVWIYKHDPTGSTLPPPIQPPAIPTIPSSTSWQQRSTGLGVVRAVGFDNASDIAGRYGNPTGLFAGSVTTASLDMTLKAAGLGSLKFIIPSQSDANAAGTYFANFSDDYSVQFDENQAFYVQWQQWISTELLNTIFTGAGGWKQAIIGTGDVDLVAGSCSDLEIVVQNTNSRGLPQMYNSCRGSESHPAYDPFNEPFGNFFKLQNAIPDPYCLNLAGYPNCEKYVAGEWMTFQVGIYLGSRIGDEFKNSWVRLWVARQGQPSRLVINWGPYGLTAGDGFQRFGKIWLLPFNTGKDPTQTHATAITYYDNLIVSRSVIPDAIVEADTPPPPPLPDQCVVDPLRITGVKWPTSQTGTRSLTWNSGLKKIAKVEYAWPPTATFIDDRGCKVTVKK